MSSNNENMDDVIDTQRLDVMILNGSGRAPRPYLVATIATETKEILESRVVLRPKNIQSPSSSDS